MNSQATKWLIEECQLNYDRLIALPGDASFRRYFRVYLKNQTYIFMDASAEPTSCRPFVAIADALRAKNLKTPSIFAKNLQQGFLLISDFGDCLLLNELKKTTQPAELYQKALDDLLILQSCSEDDIKNYQLPRFTAEFMHNELVLFQEWFLEKHLGLFLSNDLQVKLNNCFSELANAAFSQPSVFMHRDYHAANLMILPNSLGILDFQDAFRGPITYDLVSLLRDCYINWPLSFIEKQVFYFWEKLPLSISFAEFLKWFDWMGLQRHLKALLTFSRKYRRDGHPGYLQHIPRTLNYIIDVSAKYPEFDVLHFLFKTKVQEKCVP